MSANPFDNSPMVDGASEWETEMDPERPPGYRSRTPSTSSSSDSDSDSEGAPGPLCTDCEERHHRRRLVVCIDGAWTLPSGTDGTYEGNASNMYRIWCTIKEGLVTDAAGNEFDQIRAPFVDAGEAASEDGILKVYKRCCSLCPSDEVMFFGNGTGAFSVRTVAGLLHHLGALPETLTDQRAKFLESLKLYREALSKFQFLGNTAFQSLKAVAGKVPRVKYIGLIESIRARPTDSFHDLDSIDYVQHVRHALALFERKSTLAPERFRVPHIPPDHSVQEAWFAGTRRNLGGACPQDGLALWPLHWLLAEAQAAGLATHFDPNKVDRRCTIPDPLELVRLRRGDAEMYGISRHGISTRLSDFSRTLEMDGYSPNVFVGGGSLPSSEECRSIFPTIKNQSNEASGTFIHPSVFLFDFTDLFIVQVVSMMSFGAKLREEQRFTILPNHELFWALNKELLVCSRADRPRILLCGQTHSGKTSLIGSVLERELDSVSHGAAQGQHNIEVAMDSETTNIVLHDSQGFQSGGEHNYDHVQTFLTKRRASPHFLEQVHCVWYCVSVELPRIQGSDKKFARLDFGGVPVVLVFTKHDSLVRSKKAEALAEFNRRHRTRHEMEDLGSLPAVDKEAILERASELQAEWKAQIVEEWERRLPVFRSSAIFVENPSYSNQGQETIDALLRRSTDAMTSERMGQIHARAQEVVFQAKLTQMVAATVKLCDEQAGWWSSMKRNEIAVQRAELARVAVQNAMRVFAFRGLRPATLAGLLSETLWGVATESSTSTGRKVGLFALQALWGAAHIAFPPLAFVTVPAMVGAHWGISLQQSNMMVVACAEVLLVFDRMFWYGDALLEEKHVRAALVHYVKIRPQLLKALTEKLSLTDSITRMGPMLTSVIAEYRYRRPTLRVG